MKNKINFETLQRLDKVDANDLQANIYSQIEDFTQGMFRSGVYGVANTADRLDAAKRRAMHGPITPVPNVSIDQANSNLSITSTFSVVERNTGDVISFSQEDIDLGYGVMSTASVQSWVDDNESVFRQNDINGGGYTGLAIFAYPVSDQKREDRNFYDAVQGGAVLNNTVTRNRTRLNLFVDIYERRINLTDSNGNYPTFIGKWELGRIESNVRTENNGVYTLNPVVEWPTQAGWISNLVWNWVFPDSLNVMNTVVHSDRSVANASKLPNTVTEPVSLRYDGAAGNTTHDLRLMFKHVERLVDRIQCAGLLDPSTTDLGARADSALVLDQYGVQTGDSKTVTAAIHAEHPPYSLRGLKRFIDIEKNNKVLTAAASFRLHDFTCDSSLFSDGVARLTRKAIINGPTGDFPLGIGFDHYDVYTADLGVSAPVSTDTTLTRSNARANATTGLVENTSGTATVTGNALEHLFSYPVITFPSQYANWNIVNITLTPIYKYPAQSGESSLIYLSGPGPKELSNSYQAFAAVLVDPDENHLGYASGFSRPSDDTGLIQVQPIAYTDANGTKNGSYGLKFIIGPSALMQQLPSGSSPIFGFNISVSIKNNVVESE